ncbi:uncharacterized protein LOC125942751 isoform X1 [Dermacentor silvarum]|uniref:uncharacterized protein LOC125942751 isoform X1 n=1 Tax=Dermacentor silvarum TaxID=543639 RepID=UPI00210170CC|nr:uncharacterized protein LOC125942751 isoform X1 [Dermacentor silvarum]
MIVQSFLEVTGSGKSLVGEGLFHQRWLRIRERTKPKLVHVPVPMTRINGDIRSNLSATGHAEKTPGDSRIPSSLRSHLCDHKLATKLRFLTNKLLCSKFSKTRAK